MKMFIVGHAGHGKDTVAKMFEELIDVSACSSSEFACERIVMPFLRKRGLVYSSPGEAHADRGSHRMLWREAIREYTKDDPARLAKEIFRHHEIYVGVRSRDEFMECQKIVDISMWVESYPRVMKTDESLDILCSDCDISIFNGGDVFDTHASVARLCGMISRRAPTFTPSEN